jgi:3-phenylpropionate/trans-cinnamate dioxygenase ferredoxin subunit
MAEFVDAGMLDQLPPDTGMVVTVEGKSVALFKVDGTVYAISDSCVHAGASLGAGKLAGKIVTCRAHGLRYDVTTGQVTSTTGLGVEMYPVQVVSGRIMVAVSKAPLPGPS